MWNCAYCTDMMALYISLKMRRIRSSNKSLKHHLYNERTLRSQFSLIYPARVKDWNLIDLFGILNIVF